MNCNCEKALDVLKKDLADIKEQIEYAADEDEKAVSKIQSKFLLHVKDIINLHAPHCACFNGRRLMNVRNVVEANAEKYQSGNIQPRDIHRHFGIVKENIRGLE